MKAAPEHDHDAEKDHGTIVPERRIIPCKSGRRAKCWGMFALARRQGAWALDTAIVRPVMRDRRKVHAIPGLRIETWGTRQPQRDWDVVEPVTAGWAVIHPGLPTNSESFSKVTRIVLGSCASGFRSRSGQF